MANSVDPGQTPHNAASDQGLHYLFRHVRILRLNVVDPIVFRNSLMIIVPSHFNAANHQDDVKELRDSSSAGLCLWIIILQLRYVNALFYKIITKTCLFKYTENFTNKK